MTGWSESDFFYGCWRVIGVGFRSGNEITQVVTFETVFESRVKKTGFCREIPRLGSII